MPGAPWATVPYARPLATPVTEDTELCTDGGPLRWWTFAMVGRYRNSCITCRLRTGLNIPSSTVQNVKETVEVNRSRILLTASHPTECVAVVVIHSQYAHEGRFP